MCILFNIFQRFAANKELTVAHEIIQLRHAAYSGPQPQLFSMHSLATQDCSKHSYNIMNECKRLLAETKNIKLHKNNRAISKIKQYIYQRCYQVTKNIYGNSKSLNLSLINLAYRYSNRSKQQDFSKCFKLEGNKAFTTVTGRLFHAQIRLQANKTGFFKVI